jgi:hypothetical protein
MAQTCFISYPFSFNLDETFIVMKTLLLLLIVMVSVHCLAQNNGRIGIGTTAPDNSALLDVQSQSKGMLLPRMTSQQRKNIVSPAMGLLVFDTDKNTLMFFDGTAWRAMSFSNENDSAPLSVSAQQPASSSAFGSRVAISGNYSIIGAPRYSGSNLNNQGLAFVFEKTGSGWRQAARLAAPDSAAGDYFGGSVAISGDYAIVGSSNKTVNAKVAQGKAYIYHRVGSSWVLEHQQVKTNGLAYDNFGWAVGICAYNTGGPAVAIGAPYSDAGGADKGEVQFLRKAGSSWNTIQTLVPTDLGLSDYYGFTIAMDTDYVAIGATGQDNLTYAYADAGAAYVYAYGGGVWNFQQKISGTTAQGQFGFAIALSSSRLAVGAPWRTTYSNTSASVNLYDRAGSSWTNIWSGFLYNFEIMPQAGQVATTTGTSISIANTTFGISLSLYGKTLLVGSSGGTDYPNGGSSYYSDRVGAVYVYKNLTGNSYTRVRTIEASPGLIGNLFGQSIAISGENYILGNSKATAGNVYNAGEVYFGYEAGN